MAAAIAAFVNRRGERSRQPAAPPGPSLVRSLIGVGVILGIAFVVESGVEQWSSVYLEDSLGSGPAVSGLGPGLFAASMATGRMLAQRTSRGTAAARIVFAGVAAAAGIAISVATHEPAIALLGLVTAGAGLALSAPTLFGEAGRIAGAGRRGAGISTVAVLSYTGFLIGPPLFGAVAGATSLRGGFILLCGAAVLLAVAAAAPTPQARKRGLAGLFLRIGGKSGDFQRLLLHFLPCRRRIFPPAFSRSNKVGKGRACTKSATRWCIRTTEQARS